MKKKAVKKKGVKPKQGVVTQLKIKTKWVKRVMPVEKIYKLHYPYVFAYEDGLQVCKFTAENQKAFDNVIFHLKALAYKEDRT